MLRRDYTNQHCAIAGTLELIGERWTILIIRDAFLGIRRFDDLQRSLGIARNVLQSRLERLVEEGILERSRYQERPPRFEYRLTDKGRDLWTVLTAMRQWGDRWAAPSGPPLQVVHRACGEITDIVPTCAHCGEQLEARDLQPVAGPGAAGDALVPVRRTG